MQREEIRLPGTQPDGTLRHPFRYKIAQTFKDIAFGGLLNARDIEAQRLVLIINLYCLVGIAFLSVFAIHSVFNNHIQLATILGLFMLVGLGNIIYLRQTGSYRAAGDVVVISMLSLSLYLIMTGGIENTGPLWSYALPPLILFIYGLSKGSIVLTLFMINSIVLMFFPNNGIATTQYDYTFSVRYHATFLVVCFISSICEYARFHSYNTLKKLQQRMQFEAHTDELTGLHNRRYMYQQLELKLEKIKRYQRPYSLLLCDLDHFKNINDSYGHPCGDQVLVESAIRMRKCIRRQDIAARWGGEEFMLLLPETRESAAVQVAEKIRAHLCNSNIHCTNDSLQVTTSIGIVEIHPDDDLETILNKVDDALYDAKREGRNCVKTFREKAKSYSTAN